MSPWTKILLKRFSISHSVSKIQVVTTVESRKLTFVSKKFLTSSNHNSSKIAPINRSDVIAVAISTSLFANQYFSGHYRHNFHGTVDFFGIET